MNQFATVLAEFVRIADYHEQALREYRRLRGGSTMDNRMIAAERFIDERQHEALRVVARASLQREAVQGAKGVGTRAGGLSRVFSAFRRTLSHSLRSGSGQVLQRETPRRVPVAVEIRRS